MSEEADKTAGILAKIKAKQWKEMGRAIEKMREFSEAQVIESFLDGLKETWRRQVADALSPLNNEVNELVTAALDPLMPMITTFLNDFTDLITNWEVKITLGWEGFLSDIMKGMEGFDRDVERMWQGFLRDTKIGWKGFLKDIGKGWEGFLSDIGKGWSGFWRDLGWK